MPPRYWHLIIYLFTCTWFIVLKYGEALVRKFVLVACLAEAGCSPNFVSANENRVCSIIFVIECSSSIWDICRKFHFWCIKQVIAKYLHQSLTYVYIEHMQTGIHDVPDNLQSIVYRSVTFRGVKVGNYWYNILYHNCSLACYKKELKKHILSTLYFGSHHPALMN